MRALLIDLQSVNAEIRMAPVRVDALVLELSHIPRIDEWVVVHFREDPSI